MHTFHNLREGRKEQAHGACISQRLANVLVNYARVNLWAFRPAFRRRESRAICPGSQTWGQLDNFRLTVRNQTCSIWHASDDNITIRGDLDDAVAHLVAVLL